MCTAGEKDKGQSIHGGGDKVPAGNWRVITYAKTYFKMPLFKWWK